MLGGEALFFIYSLKYSHIFFFVFQKVWERFLEVGTNLVDTNIYDGTFVAKTKWNQPLYNFVIQKVLLRL